MTGSSSLYREKEGGRKTYRALKLQRLQVGGMVRLEFYRSAVEGGEEGFGEGEFGHLCDGME